MLGKVAKAVVTSGQKAKTVTPSPRPRTDVKPGHSGVTIREISKRR